MLYKLFLSIFVILFSLFLSARCEENFTCIEEFDITYAGAFGVSFSVVDPTISSLLITVSETVPVGSVLYTIAWKKALSKPPYINENSSVLDTALEFVDFNYNDSDMSVYVDNSMVWITDLNNPNLQSFLEVSFYFDFADANTLCEIIVRQEMEDENTQIPHFEFQRYQTTLSEAYPLSFTIPGLQLLVIDYDGSYPNNYLNISSNTECPLQPTESFYMAGIPPAYVYFSLNKSLDYDNVGSFYDCKITVQDNGETPLTSSANISVVVLSVSDEKPVFDSMKYVAILDETFVGSIVNVQIKAVDGDIPPNNDIVYSMTSADRIVGGDEYFSLDSLSGEVTVIKNISAELISWNSVNFVLTACDGDNQCGNSLLAIHFPQPEDSERLNFDKNNYATAVDSPSDNQHLLQIQTINNQEDVRYYFVDDGSPGLQYFDINEMTGEITTTQIDTLPGDYGLIVNVTDGFMLAKITVKIQILLRMPEDAVVMESLVNVYASENVFPTEIHTVTGEGANFFCILSVNPPKFYTYFNITETGTIFLIKATDGDDPSTGDYVTIKVASYSTKPTRCIPTAYTDYVNSNEVLVKVQIGDYNDNVPYFVDGQESDEFGMEILYAFPLEVALQKAIGRVATVKAQDNDTAHNLTYNMFPYEPFSYDAFAIDQLTGDIFLTGEMTPTKFNVSVTDSYYTSSMLVHIDVLTTDYISTIYFYNMSMGEIENRISEMAALSNIKLYLLYTNVIQPKNDGRTVEAHVYATMKMTLLNDQDIMSSLQDAHIDADVKPFSGKEIFMPFNDAYKRGTIALGCIGGVLLLLTLGFILRKTCSK